MTRRLLGVDPLTGTAQYSDYDEGDDTFRYSQEQNVDALIDWNRRLYNEPKGRHGESMTRVASVPMTLYLELQQQGILDDPVRLKRWLNDPDNRAFRTHPGAV
jgi:hypothetical protein